MTAPEPASRAIGVDHEPADQCDVLRWLAAQTGAPLPRVEAPSGVGTRRHRTNKRCGTVELLRSGYVFRHPTFREGYTARLAERNMK
jgi:hypothetical protein